MVLMMVLMMVEDGQFWLAYWLIQLVYVAHTGLLKDGWAPVKLDDWVYDQFDHIVLQ